MESQRLSVESELYSEGQFKSATKLDNSNSLLAVKFHYNEPNENLEVDEDGDMVVRRKKSFQIEIEVSQSTTITMVGLQLWLGALVLGDFVLYNGPTKFKNKTILELGAGVGLTSIIAGMFAKQVISTDVPFGGVLDLIRRNLERNKNLIKSKMDVVPLDFFSEEWTPELTSKVDQTDIILAADVIYDNELTEGFVKTLTRILSNGRKKTIYIAIEKRYVFTTADLDAVAPCHEFFLECIKTFWRRPPMSLWSMDKVEIDFPQYFDYKRNRHIILWKITN